MLQDLDSELLGVSFSAAPPLGTGQHLVLGSELKGRGQPLWGGRRLLSPRGQF